MSEKGTQPTILLIEQDDDTRPLLRYNLRHQGYRVLVALDEEDAVEWTGSGHEHSDLILLNQFKLTIDESVDMGRRIRQSAGFSQYTPIVVIAERFGAELEGKDIRVGKTEYVTYPEDAQQLLNLLQRLCRQQ